MAPAIMTNPRINIFRQVTKLLAIVDVSTPKASATNILKIILVINESNQR